MKKALSFFKKFSYDDTDYYVAKHHVQAFESRQPGQLVLPKTAFAKIFEKITGLEWARTTVPTVPRMWWMHVATVVVKQGKTIKDLR